MAAARAADAHGQVALPFRPVLRNQELQQRLQAGEELLCRRPLQHPVRDPGVRPWMRLESLDEVRIREEPHVEHQVARLRDPVAEPEAEQGHVQLVVLPRSAEPRRDRVAQLVHVHSRGVEDLVRQRAELGQHAPLLRDAFLDAAVRAERMPPPGFRETPDEHVVGAVEEDHLELVAFAPHLLDGARRRVQEAPLPRVDHDGETLHLVAGAVTDQLQQLGQEHDGEVVDAEEPEVLERLGRGGFPSPGKPGHQHDAVRVRAPPRWIVLCDLGHYSTSSPIPRVSVACAISRESFSWNSFAEWWPCSLSRWLRAATSTMVVRFRPGRTGMTNSGTSMSRMEYFCSSTPRRSYSTLSSHSTSSTTISTFFRSRTAETPNRSLMLMMPMPRISMWCLMISLPLPCTDPPCRRLRSTMSSATSRCPRVTRSSASSLLPMPLLPRIRTPTPITSMSTPWTEVEAVSASWRKRSTLSMNP